MTAKPNTATDPSALLQALQTFQERHYAQAETLFKAAQAENPNHPTPTLYLAQIALINGDAQDWLSPLETLIQQHPYLKDAYHVLAQVYQQSGDLPRAAHYFYQCLSLHLTQPLTEPPTDTKSAATLENHHHQAQDPSSALTTLWQTLARFKQAQQPAFATAGTLLGLERTGSLLPNDKDIDIGIDWLHMNDAVNLLQQNGWQEWQRSYDLINPRCFKNADGLVLDLCGYATEQTTQTVVSGLWMDKVPFEWNRITVFPAITLTQRNSPAGRVWHLKQPQTFLNALYGEDWSTPDPTFDTIVCAHNLRRFSWLAQCYAYSRLYQHLKQRRYAKALSQTRCIRRHRPEDPLLQQLQKQLETLTSQKADRVLALGYFDLIHIGHLNYLNYAKQQGQTLVVGVAPDAFSQQSKGYSPVLPESQRLKMVAALNPVDEVHLVATPMAHTQAAADWIRSLNIHTVVCGEEWQNTERWQRLSIELKKHHINVQYAPKTADISTTTIKQRIQKTTQ